MSTKTTEEVEKDLTQYELMVIIAPDISEEKTNKELDKIRKLIKSFDGTITHEDIWGMRNLAYRISKHDNGYYAVLNFKAHSSLIPELNKTLQIEGNILRFLVTKPPRDYIIKSQSEYEKEAEEMKAEEEKNKPKTKKAPVKKAIHKKEEKKEEVKKEVKKEEKEAPKKEEKPKKAPVKEEKKEEVEEKQEEPKEPKEPKEDVNKQTLDELDEKLKSIIDDSDISL